MLLNTPTHNDYASLIIEDIPPITNDVEAAKPVPRFSAKQLEQANRIYQALIAEHGDRSQELHFLASIVKLAFGLSNNGTDLPELDLGIYFELENAIREAKALCVEDIDLIEEYAKNIEVVLYTTIKRPHEHRILECYLDYRLGLNFQECATIYQNCSGSIKSKLIFILVSIHYQMAYGKNCLPVSHTHKTAYRESILSLAKYGKPNSDAVCQLLSEIALEDKYFVLAASKIFTDTDFKLGAEATRPIEEWCDLFAQGAEAMVDDLLADIMFEEQAIIRYGHPLTYTVLQQVRHQYHDMLD